MFGTQDTAGNATLEVAGWQITVSPNRKQVLAKEIGNNEFLIAWNGHQGHVEIECDAPHNGVFTNYVPVPVLAEFMRGIEWAKNQPSR